MKNYKEDPIFLNSENESSSDGDYFPDHIIKTELMIVTLGYLWEAAYAGF